MPEAVVEHHYSHSAGQASGLKAYYVERNRLFVLVKNFPGAMLLAAPFVTMARYWWHAWFLWQGRGSAARFRAEGNAGPKMAWYILRAHAALIGVHLREGNQSEALREFERYRLRLGAVLGLEPTRRLRALLPG